MKNNVFLKLVKPLIERSGTFIASALLTSTYILDPVLADQIAVGTVAVLLVLSEILLGSKKER